MEESRRGFLKTLGKLTAAVGLTAAAASTVEAKKSTTPSGEVNHETFIDIMEVPKDALLDFKPNGDVVRTPIKPGSLIPTEKFISPTLNRAYHHRNVEANRLCQETMNEMYNAQVDNIQRAYSPQMVLSQEDYDTYMKWEQTSRLDPYKWGDVFEVKWHKFRARADMYLYEGWWEARVKPAFNKCFASAGSNEIFRANVVIDAQLIGAYKNWRSDQDAYERDRFMIVERKRAAYIKLVDELQRVIRQECGPEEIFLHPHEDPSRRDLSKINGITD